MASYWGRDKKDSKTTKPAEPASAKPAGVVAAKPASSSSAKAAEPVAAKPAEPRPAAKAAEPAPAAKAAGSAATKPAEQTATIRYVDRPDCGEIFADSINHLLLVGFYLINVGYVTLALKYGDKATNIQELLEVLSTKIGAVLLILGGMHFFNLYVFNKMRKRALLHGAPPPLPPHAHIAVAGQL